MEIDIILEALLNKPKDRLSINNSTITKIISE